MSAPTISVIMPCRDMARFLPDAIGSIRRQAIAVHEILLVDDGSSDGTAETADRLAADGAPIRVLQGEQQGPGPARNLALKEAAGELVAFLDADDLWPAGKLERQVARLAERPELGMVSGFVTYFETLDSQGVAPAEGSRTETLFHVHLGACLYRRWVFDQVGGFDRAFLFGEDTDLLLRLRDGGVPFTILRAVTLFYRRHPQSMMEGPNPRRASDFRLAIMKSLRRRREAGLPPADQAVFEAYLEPQEPAP